MDRRSMVRAALVFALVAALAVPGVLNAAATTDTSNEIAPFAAVLDVDCLGEPVLLSGWLHTLVRSTVDQTGGIHFRRLSQPQGVTGIGLVTGATWQGTGATQSTTNVPAAAGFEDTFVNSFKIIGRGGAANYLVQATFHITVDATGALATAVAHATVECR
ncbi:MAG TPA: hypothetical protein VI540_01265 [Gaiellaceae bacterium]|nr:hypothetical protein [Gaiellaceae bacterium]